MDRLGNTQTVVANAHLSACESRSKKLANFDPIRTRHVFQLRAMACNIDRSHHGSDLYVLTMMGLMRGTNLRLKFQTRASKSVMKRYEELAKVYHLVESTSGQGRDALSVSRLIAAYPVEAANIIHGLGSLYKPPGHIVECPRELQFSCSACLIPKGFQRLRNVVASFFEQFTKTINCKKKRPINWDYQVHMLKLIETSSAAPSEEEKIQVMERFGIVDSAIPSRNPTVRQLIMWANNPE